jgi:PAS domain S-box-containing protein
MNGKQAKALLIEDDPLYAQAIRGLFMAKGVAFELEWASSLAAGLARLAQNDIDIVLLDLALPDSEGLETFNRIHRSVPDLPVIVLTVTNNDDLAIQAMQAGAQDYLVKGEINRHLLQRAMRYAIERQRSESALRESQRLIQEIADVTPEIIAIYDLDEQRSVYVNRQLSNILGYTTGQLTELTPKDWVVPDDYPRLEELFKRLRHSADGEVLEIEYRARHAQGGVRWLHSELTVFARREDGEARQVLITSHDITQRRRTEEALRRSEERYRDLVENSGLFVALHDAEGRILNANKKVLEFLGVARAEELRQRNVSEFIQPDTPDSFQRYLEKVLKEGHATGTTKLQAPIGQLVIIEYDNTLRQTSSQKPIIRCIGRDVTEREQSAEAIRTNEERYRDLVENSGLLIGTHDVEGRFLSVNQATWKFFGVGGAEGLEGRRISELLPPAAQARFEEYLQSVVKQGSAQGLIRVNLADGEERLLEFDNSLRQDKPGQIVIRYIARDVTERQQSERKIRESEERFRLIAEKSTDMIGRYSVTGETLYVSPAVTRILGYEPEECTGRSFYEFFHAEDVETVRRAHTSLLESPATQNVTYRCRHKDGHYVWCESNARLVRQPSNGGNGSTTQEILAITRDVSERQQAGEALRESEERYRDLFENANDIVFTTDLDGNFTSFNKAGELITGYTRAEVVEQSALGSFTQEFRKAVLEMLENRASGKSKTRYELALTSKEGQELILELSVRLITKYGKPVGVQAIARDITERKRTDEERAKLVKQLEAERTLLQAVLRQMPAGVLIAEAPSGQVILVNEQAAKIMRRSVHDLRNGVKFEAFHLEGKRYQPDEWPLTRAIKEGETVTGEQLQLRRSDGALITLQVEAAPIRNRRGRIVAGVMAFSDITERRLTEEQIREQAALLNSAQDAIAVLDLEGRVLFWNRGAERLYGWSSAEVLNQRLDELLYAEPDAQRTDEINRELHEQGEWNGELRQRTNDKREIIVESRWTLVRDDLGKPKSVLVINTDLTSRKQLESQVLRMQRLESIGSLASGIAHDLNNALAPILMALHTLQQRFTDPNSQHWLSLIRKSAERSRDLVDQVLTFARGASGARLPLDLDELLLDLAAILKETLPKNIKLEVSVPDDLWPIVGDKTQVHQVLMNLCLNARDAMPQGGQLSVRAENAQLKQQDVWTHEGVKPGPFVRITVADTGTGMPPEVLDRIFEPFFTTKEQGKGSGLGLSTSSGIVRGHGGFIEVKSELGKGSRFIVCLPADEDALDWPLEQEKEEEQGDLILVVDDEPTLLEVTQATLETAGYRVVAVSDGNEALLAYRKQHKHIKAVLTDLAMPGMDGLAASLAMQAINPEVKIIATSGLRSQQNIEDAKRTGVQAILWKPYTADELLDKLAEVLQPETVAAK